MSDKITNLAQLRAAALEARGMIGQVASAAAEAIEEVMPAAQAVTLAVTGWTGGGPYSQTADVPGVLADEGAQLVQIVPASASRETWRDAGVECTGQGDGTLAFTAQEKPGGSLKIFVVLQEVRV